MNMPKSRVSAGVLIVLGLLGAGTVSVGNDANHHARVEQSFQELTALDHELKQHVLASRQGVLNRYDPLVETGASLTRLGGELSTQLGDSHPETAGSVDALLQAIDRRSKTLELFKADNAILTNSASYLPAALQGLAPLATMDEALHAEAERVTKIALSYQASPSPEIARQLGLALDRAEEREVVLPDDLAFDRALLFRHARKVLEGKQAMEPTLHALLDPSVSTAASELRSEYTRAYLVAEDRAQAARIVVAILVAALVALLLVVARDLRRLYATLEERIADRTAALAGKTESLAEAGQQMRRILNNVSQGLVTVDLDGRVGGAHSAPVEAWLGAPPASGLFTDWLAASSPTQAEWFALGWDDLNADFLPFDVVLAQLPSRLNLKDRFIQVDYKPILAEDGSLARVLVVMSDQTAQLRQAQLEREQRESLKVFQALGRDRAGLTEFVDEATALVDALRADAPAVLVKRILHTLKGNAATFGLDTLADACHELESRLFESEEPATDAELDVVRAAWTRTADRIAPFLGAEEGAYVPSKDLHHLVSAIDEGLPLTVVRNVVQTWTMEPARTRLERVADQSVRIANRLGKTIEVVIRDHDLCLEPEALGGFWSAFVHVLRNAVDHGIEDQLTRKGQGKSPTGRLTLSVSADDGSVTITAEDDGAGLDWDALRERAAEHGLPSDTEDDLVQALFTDGLSTATEVTDVSGRGVGMAAVRAATEELGGRIHVLSRRGVGTRMSFTFPNIEHTVGVELRSLARGA